MKFKFIILLFLISLSLGRKIKKIKKEDEPVEKLFPE
jgi:hypothetical protein